MLAGDFDRTPDFARGAKLMKKKKKKTCRYILKLAIGGVSIAN